jgi:hypothetical protein
MWTEGVQTMMQTGIEWPKVDAGFGSTPKVDQLHAMFDPSVAYGLFGLSTTGLTNMVFPAVDLECTHTQAPHQYT